MIVTPGRWMLASTLVVGCSFVKPPKPSGVADGNTPVDGSFDAPDLAANRMFVTSGTWPMVTISSLDVADSKCQAAAMNASPPLSGTYVAWLSSDTVNAKDRLGTAGGWVRVDGKPFANSASDLALGRMFYPPRITENGDDLGLLLPAAHVATMTGLTGMADFDCQNLTGTGMVTYGLPDGGPTDWTATATMFCAATAHLYCFQTDKHGVDVTPAPVTSQRAFLLSTPLGSGIGTSGMDEKCASEGAGAFVAFVAPTSAAARDRITIPGPRFRFDGVEWTPDLLTFEAPLSLEAGGTYAKVPVWTGAQSTTTPGGGPTNCNNWSGGVMGIVGTSSRSNELAFDEVAVDCGSPQYVYCVEQ